MLRGSRRESCQWLNYTLAGNFTESLPGRHLFVTGCVLGSRWCGTLCNLNYFRRTSRRLVWPDGKVRRVDGVLFLRSRQLISKPSTSWNNAFISFHTSAGGQCVGIRD